MQLVCGKYVLYCQPTGLRTATWRRRTGSGKRRSTGNRRTGTRRGQGGQERQDREEESTEK